MCAGHKEQSELVAFISLFLVKFQLAHRISNSVITMILKFCLFFSHIFPNLSQKSKIRCLFQHLCTICEEILKPVVRYTFNMRSALNAISFTTASLCLSQNQMFMEKVSARCKYVAFPNHPHKSRRSTCGEPLMKQVKYKSKILFHPRQVYCYCSIKRSLSILMETIDFWDM